MNNNTLKKQLAQALFSKIFQIEHPELSFDEITNRINTLSKGEIVTLNQLIKLSITYSSSVTPGQGNLGYWTGRRHRSTISRHCKQLQSLGLITIRSGKDRWTSNSYTVHPLIFDSAPQLKHIFPALKKLCQIILCQSALSDNLKNDSLKKCDTIRDNYLYNYKLLVIKKAESFVVKKLTDFKNKFLRKPEEEVQKQNLIIPSPVEKIVKAINLNTEERTRLLIYPERALAYVFEELRRQSGLKAPFYWILKRLEGYCKQNKLHIERDLLPTMMAAEGIKPRYQGSYFFPSKNSSTKSSPSLVKQHANDRVIVDHAYKPIQVKKQEPVRVSPLIGKYDKPHSEWAQFIPADLVVA